MFDARTVMLCFIGAGWLTVVVVTAINNRGEVPPATLAALGIGIGTILAAFRVDDLARRHRPPPEPPLVPTEPTDGP